MCATCGKGFAVGPRTNFFDDDDDEDNEDQGFDAVDVCSYCSTRGKTFTFAHIPLSIQIKLLFRNPEWAKAIRLPGPGPIGPIHGSQRYQEKFYKTGFIRDESQHRYLGVSFHTDGVNPFNDNYKYV